MDREQTARNYHNSGINCANSVYSAFSDKVTGIAPTPRSEGGKCGAVLAGEKILSQLGLDTGSFDEKYMEQFGSLKCAELRKAKHPCNDLVGAATKLVDEMV